MILATVSKCTGDCQPVELTVTDRTPDETVSIGDTIIAACPFRREMLHQGWTVAAVRFEKGGWRIMAGEPG
jgi:hypothetical protein